MLRKRIHSMALATGLLATMAGGILLKASPASAAVACKPHKGHTGGRIDCTGSGTVRLVIDCKRPQIGDYKSPWTAYNGTLRLEGECRHGINSVQYQVK